MERRLARSEAADQRANFVETMNLLNICAKACREKLFPKRTRALAESYVVQAIANIHSIPELRSDIEAMMTSSTTFRDLAAFALANRPAIALANEEVRALLEAEASRHSPPEIENR